jgi:hypothetical protein
MHLIVGFSAGGGSAILAWLMSREFDVLLGNVDPVYSLHREAKRQAHLVQMAGLHSVGSVTMIVREDDSRRHRAPSPQLRKQCSLQGRLPQVRPDHLRTRQALVKSARAKMSKLGTHRRARERVASDRRFSSIR